MKLEEGAGQRPRRGQLPMLSHMQKFLLLLLPQNRDLGLEAGFWALRMGYGPQVWDLSLETGIWAPRLGFGPQTALKGVINSLGRMKDSPPVFYRTMFPWGPLPCFLTHSYNHAQQGIGYRCVRGM